MNLIERIHFVDLNNFIRNKYISSMVAAILLLLLLWQGWAIVQIMQTKPVAQVTMTPVASDVTTAALPDLADMHLFGIPANDAALAPETRLGLQLKSIFLSTKNSGSKVLIAVGEDTKTYAAGDILAGNAVIEEILSDRIVIRYNGHLETLSLQRQYPDLNQRFSE